ncbi:MAG TPA: cation:proton antiporter, partial [Pyrinomonadaceae bacterium]|nr:cation:proton antiporter [Pyrinomonadaceae bacterium]
MTFFLAAAVEGQTRVLLTLFLMLVAAKLMAEIFERLRQPSVVGEILAGIVIGPSVFGLIAPSEITD